MKKIVLVVLVFVALIGISLVPFNKEFAVSVNAPYINCYTKLMITGNWHGWQPDIHKIDTSLLKITKIPQGNKIILPGGYILIQQQGSNGLQVNRVINNSSFNYSYTVISGDLGILTTVVVTYKTNIIKNLIPSFARSDLNKTSINDFKRFMENISLYYGFNIKQDFEKERKIIVRKKTIAAALIYVEAAEIYKQLLQYTTLKKLTQTAPTMMQFNRKNGDSVQLLMGIPVNKQIKTDNGFLYMDIPATKVLVANFNGKYRDKQKIYSAMANYIQDKYLHPKIAPLELYKGKLPVSDATATQFQLTYPIY